MILYLVRIEVSPRIIVKGYTLELRGNTLINMSNTVCYSVCQKAILTQGSFIIHYLGNRKHVPCFYKIIETWVEDWENEKCCGTASYIACENSRPSSLPAEWRFARRTSAIHRRKFHTDDVNVNFIILNKLSFAVTKGLCQAANVLHSHKCTS